MHPAKTPQNECIFCKIADGTLSIPGIFWQNDIHMAFLSRDPNTEGFSCVIPKKHFGSDVLRMPDQDLQEFILAAKKVAHVLENHFTDVGRVGLVMEGTGIDHAHIKLVPMHQTENLKDGQWEQYSSGKEFWFDSYEGWLSSGAGPVKSDEDLKNLAEAIKKSDE